MKALIPNLNLTLVALLFWLMPCLIGKCQSHTLELKDIVGKEFETLDEFEIFKGFVQQGGALIQDPSNSNYGFLHYKREEIGQIVFVRTINTGDRVRYQLMDVLEITNLKKDQRIAYSECKQNKIPKPEIIAICQKPKDKEVEVYRIILKAWRINWATKKIEAIDTKGIECYNDGYVVD